MSSYATILVEKHALPSVQESITLGKQILEGKLHTYTRRLQEFETNMNMDTQTFVTRFENGELGDDKEWFEWDYLANVVKGLQKKLQDLETVQYES